MLSLNLTVTQFHTMNNTYEWLVFSENTQKVSIWISWTWCQPLGWVLGFAKAWLRLRQRTQTEECCRYSPLCGERQRNAGCQATYTDTNEHSQRPRAMREGQATVKHHSPLPSVISYPSPLDNFGLVQFGCLNTECLVEELMTDCHKNGQRLDTRHNGPNKNELIS